MALITRFTRLFTADMHAVLDRLEEPQVVLKQAIRDMEEDVAQRAARIAALEAEAAQLQRQLCELERSLTEIAAQLDICFDSAQPDLARGVIKRRLEMERLGKRMHARRALNRETAAVERATQDEHQRQLDAMRQHASVLLESLVVTPSSASVSLHADAPVTEADIDVALLREHKRRSQS
jgi:phage shock protein A